MEFGLELELGGQGARGVLGREGGGWHDTRVRGRGGRETGRFEWMVVVASMVAYEDGP